MGTNSERDRPPAPPTRDALPLVNASDEVARWLEHYWSKLRLPAHAAHHLAVTTDRQEFGRWTGRRLNPMALGCYCFLPDASGGPRPGDGADQDGALGGESATLSAPALAGAQPALPGFADDAASSAAHGERRGGGRLPADHRHLIFIEPGLLPMAIEVTVAHELIHLSDRVQGRPRKHRCHGYDSISVDEAAITGRDPEFLRDQLREETQRREAALRRVRPYRYLYVCRNCGGQYPRVRRYARPVSCGRCDRHYNAALLLELRELPPNGGALAVSVPAGQPPAAG